MPSSSQVMTPFGRFVRTVRPKGRELDVRQTLELTQSRIEPGEYPAFRKFLLKIDQLFAEKVFFAQ